MKTKVYISGKVTGDPDYRKKFAKAEKRLKEMGYDPLNPVKGEKDGKPWEYYLRRDIKKLCDCDILLLLPDWTQSKGARLERLVASRLGIKVWRLYGDGKILVAEWKNGKEV